MAFSFSVLMSVYAKEPAAWLEQSLASLLAQELQADEIILVHDGPLGPGLEQVIGQYRGKLPLNEIRLPENRGLAHALQIGLQSASHPWIARMDADDIAHPARFRHQRHFLENHPDIDVLGTWTQDFEDTPDRPCGARRPPTEPEALARYARRRCPLNHMTVMYRREAVLAVDGYQGFRGIEDYYLWAKLLVAGYRFANLPEHLVLARGGGLVADRRGGWTYLRTEARLYRAFVRLGFMSPIHALAQFLLRLPIRLIPVRMRQAIYRRLRQAGPAD